MPGWSVSGVQVLPWTLPCPVILAKMAQFSHVQNWWQGEGSWGGLSHDLLLWTHAVINTPIHVKFPCNFISAFHYFVVFSFQPVLQVGVHDIFKIKMHQSNPEHEWGKPGEAIRQDSPNEFRFPHNARLWSPVNDVGEQLTTQKDANDIWMSK